MALLGNSYDSPGGNLRMLWDRSHITDGEQAQIARVSVEAQLGIPRMCEVEVKGGPKKIADFGGSKSRIGQTISVFAYGLGISRATSSFEERSPAASCERTLVKVPEWSCAPTTVVTR